MWSRLLPALLVFFAAAGRIRAQSPNPTTCESNRACHDLYKDAKKLYKERQFAEAAEKFKQAYAVTPDPKLLFNIGRVSHKGGNAAEAVLYYRQFLASDSLDQDEESKAQKEKAKWYLAELETQAPAPPPAEPAVTPTQPVSASPSSDMFRPFYKKGWFWGVMAGSVAAVGLSVGLGVGLTPERSVPPGTNAYSARFALRF